MLVIYGYSIGIFFKFSSHIFLTKLQNMELKLHTQLETVARLPKNNKFCSNFLFIKQIFTNSIILPPKMAKNGGLKAWSHGMRKLVFHTEL